MNKLLKKIWIITAILIILAAICSSLFRSLTPWAKQYKGEVEHHLTRILGQPVTIQSMETGWYWFQPVLKLNQVILSKGEKKSLRLDKLLVGINLFKSLWEWQIQPGILFIDDLHLVVREKNARWSIDGLSTDVIKNNNMTPEKIQQTLAWLSQQEWLIIKRVSVYVHFSDGSLIPVDIIDLTVANKGGYYKINGSARLEQTNGTYFQLIGDLRFDPAHLAETKGQIYFLAKKIALDQWQSILSKTKLNIERGIGDIALWIDWDKGVVSSLQSKIQFNYFILNSEKNKKDQMIQDFSANVSWKPDEKGWQLHADHIQLKAGGIHWPENQLLIKFDQEQRSYQLIVKSILLESLFSQKLEWPLLMQKVLAFNPHGILSNTQLLIKDNQPTYILTHFEKLAWDAKENIPQVRNLSGVLNWQPNEGRLDLDSENVSIEAKGYLSQNFALLNGSFDWKELSDGLRISIERFILSQPELTLSLQGAIDQVTHDSLGNIRLITEFSAKNVEQWLPFLPKPYLKAKLYDWIKGGVKRIGEASGKIVINGLAKDFPFDNRNGEFSINSHVNNADLIVHPKWPLIKNIEGYIKINNSNFVMDVVNADFQGALVKQINLRIDDIGKGKETLLLHSIVHASGQKILNYVLASSLKEKLNALKVLSIQGPLSLNLGLEIPLYPENDENLVKANVIFKNNTISVKNKLKEFTLEEVSGGLAFDTHGVKESSLVANSGGYPLNIKVFSLPPPKSATQIIVDAKYAVDSLKNHFKSPLFSLLKGIFSVKAVLSIPNDPHEMTSIQINSLLNGLAIKLPFPLGKDQEVSMPLDVQLDFKSPKVLRFRAKYSDKLSADLLLKDNKGDLELKSGQLLLGKAQAVNQNKPGLAVVGVLDGFNLQDWKQVIDRFTKEKEDNFILKQLRVINVKLDKLTFLKQEFDQIAIKAKILPNKDWSFHLEQKNLDADLNYNLANKTLSGFIKRLHLNKIRSFNENHEPSLFHPGQIPNLNLRIDNLSLSKVQVGDVTLKSHSTAEKLVIDYCRIDSPFYQFTIEADWTRKKKKNWSKIVLQLHLKDLAKSLERWHITPAVDAGKGDVQFRGYWPGTLFDFSLAALNGALYLELKNGRITNLSPETEEKLGLGKLLSILSLQTIPRRLQLDFSDLSHQGYSFDIFKGNFDVNQGIMTTQDSYIDGPVAYASMKGQLDLVRRLYDLNLQISPHITASLPIVATIAGGPIAGVAAWVANKIINQSMQKIIAYSYKVSGPWKDPVVQQLKIVKKISGNIPNNLGVSRF